MRFVATGTGGRGDKPMSRISIIPEVVSRNSFIELDGRSRAKAYSMRARGWNW